jgi:hypothetical protein
VHLAQRVRARAVVGQSGEWQVLTNTIENFLTVQQPGTYVTISAIITLSKNSYGSRNIVLIEII